MKLSVSNIVLPLLATVLSAFARPGPIVGPSPSDFNKTSSAQSPTLELDNTSSTQTGWAEFFTSRHRSPWPIDLDDPDMRQVIRYCYANGEAKGKLAPIVADAIKMWMTALGGEAGPGSRHNLAFREVTAYNGWGVYCYKGYVDFDNPGVWNTEVASDVLAIKYDALAPILESTTGYIPDWEWNAPGRHWMRLQDVRAEYIYSIAHEFGHAMGMVHEHQRSDRDDHVFYNCPVVIGFNEAVSRAIRAGETDVLERICTDAEFAHKYEFFAGRDFIVGGTGESGHLTDGEAGYDIHSIMQYSSYIHDVNNGCTFNPSACPLLRWVGNKKDGRTKERIPRNIKPSVRDRQFVTKFYPWVGGTGTSHASSKRNGTDGVSRNAL